MKSYKDLIVWQKSMVLVTEVYKLARLLPKEEMYALSDQIRRAAVSIPSNIAEGYSRNSDKEFYQYLRIAMGSKAELETQIQIAVNLGYFTEADSGYAIGLCEETGKLLNALLSVVGSQV